MQQMVHLPTLSIHYTDDVIGKCYEASQSLDLICITVITVQYSQSSVLNTCTGKTMSEYSIQSLGLSIKATHVEVLCGFSIINGKTLVF